MAPPLFRQLRFYLTRTLSTQDKAELTQLIEMNGGQVSATPAGATQIVDCEKLDARHPEWISTEFIKDSVAFQALQDSAMYSGVIFTTGQKGNQHSRRGRMKYSVEDDARMLHFAKLRGWKSMDSVPESAWRLAEREKVTAHTAQSMHEHFRKQLQRKTIIEQRIIMTKAATISRANLLEEESNEEDVEVKEQPARRRSSPSSTGFRDVPTPDSTSSTPTQASRRTPDSARHHEGALTASSTVETRLKEVEEQKSSGKEKTRSRKPASPLRISQRLQRSEGEPIIEERESSSEVLVSPPGTTRSEAAHATPTTPATTATSTTPATPATSEVPGAQSTPMASASPTQPSTTGTQSAGKRQQKRKRRTPNTGFTNSPGAHSEVDDSDVESGRKTGGVSGVFFRSVWSDLITDPSKRRMLQRFFEPPSVSESPSQTNRAESVANDSSQVEDTATTPARDEGTERQQSNGTQVVQATDEETDKITSKLQRDTKHDMSNVVYALYYCNGDVEMAKAVLKGALPSGFWSPHDDGLLVSLVADQGTMNRATVDVAVARGDFAAMQVPRDTDAILERVQFLK